MEVRDIVTGLELHDIEQKQVFEKIAKLSPVAWRIYIQKMVPIQSKNVDPWHDIWKSSLIEGVLVNVLNTPELLFQEGQAMNHCIYTYQNRLQFERQFAFSIGETGKQDRSTVLLKYEPTSAHQWSVSVMEHHARFNRSPSATCHSVANQLCSELSSERYAEALKQANVARIRRSQSLQCRELHFQGRIRSVRDLPSARRSIDRSRARESLLMLIAGGQMRETLTKNLLFQS
jgi:hypothetical protein